MDTIQFDFAGFAEAVVNIFVIVNPLGNLPLFAGLTEDIPGREKRKLFHTAGIVAFCIILAFAFVGKYLMRDVFRISIPEFTFGGGLLLVVLGISNIMAHTRQTMHRASDKSPADEAEREINLAVSPIAFPLLVGPGSIVTVMLIVDHHGILYGVAAGATAFVFVMAVLHWSDRLLEIMGRLGTVAIGRVLQIFIVAMGVHFIFSALKQAFPALLR